MVLNLLHLLLFAKYYTFTAMNGVCQGGVLSPLIFNVYFDEMIHKLEKGGYRM